jgi:hypothetical protein
MRCAPVLYLQSMNGGNDVTASDLLSSHARAVRCAAPSPLHAAPMPLVTAQHRVFR